MASDRSSELSEDDGEATAALKIWRDIDLDSLKARLDEQSLEIAEAQEDSGATRRQLGELTVGLRGSLGEEALALIAPVLRSYQAEVDRLGTRALQSEESLLHLQRSLQEVPDPATALEDLLMSLGEEREAARAEEARAQAAEDEAEELREQLEESARRAGAADALAARVAELEAGASAEASSVDALVAASVEAERLRSARRVDELEAEGARLASDLAGARAEAASLRRSREEAEARAAGGNGDEGDVGGLRAQLVVALEDLARAEEALAEERARRAAGDGGVGDGKGAAEGGSADGDGAASGAEVAADGSSAATPPPGARPLAALHAAREEARQAREEAATARAEAARARAAEADARAQAEGEAAAARERGSALEAELGELAARLAARPTDEQVAELRARLSVLRAVGFNQVEEDGDEDAGEQGASGSTPGGGLARPLDGALSWGPDLASASADIARTPSGLPRRLGSVSEHSFSLTETGGAPAAPGSATAAGALHRALAEKNRRLEQALTAARVQASAEAEAREAAEAEARETAARLADARRLAGRLERDLIGATRAGAGVGGEARSRGGENDGPGPGEGVRGGSGDGDSDGDREAAPTPGDDKTAPVPGDEERVASGPGTGARDRGSDPDSSVVAALSAQRDRFRAKAGEAEQRTLELERELEGSRAESDSLRREAMALVERLRYVQAYRGAEAGLDGAEVRGLGKLGRGLASSGRVLIDRWRGHGGDSGAAGGADADGGEGGGSLRGARGPLGEPGTLPGGGRLGSGASAGGSQSSAVWAKYLAAYEKAALDPFAAFRAQEQRNAKRRLPIHERAVHGVGSAVISSRLARNALVLYALLLHFVIFLVLARTSHHHSQAIQAAASIPGALNCTELPLSSAAGGGGDLATAAAAAGHSHSLLDGSFASRGVAAGSTAGATRALRAALGRG